MTSAIIKRQIIFYIEFLVISLTRLFFLYFWFMLSVKKMKGSEPHLTLTGHTLVGADGVDSWVPLIAILVQLLKHIESD